MEEKAHGLNQLISESVNDEDVYKTAPATPGLLNICDNTLKHSHSFLVWDRDQMWLRQDKSYNDITHLIQSYKLIIGCSNVMWRISKSWFCLVVEFNQEGSVMNKATPFSYCILMIPLNLMPYYEFSRKGEFTIFEDTKSIVMNDIMYTLNFDN